MKRLALVLLFPLALGAQTITGKIVDPIPLPMRYVSVGLLPVGADWVVESTHTDANGIFRFFPAAPGEYVVVVKEPEFRGQVWAVHFSTEAIDVGTLKAKLFSGCESPIGNCNTVGERPLPPAPLVGLCEVLKTPERFRDGLVMMVGILTSLHDRPVLTARCNSQLVSGDLTWTNAVLLPEDAAPQQSPQFPSTSNMKKQLADLAAAVRKASGSKTSRVAVVYGFLDIPDGFSVVPCAAGSCVRTDILMPPASFLRVDGFQELK